MSGVSGLPHARFTGIPALPGGSYSETGGVHVEQESNEQLTLGIPLMPFSSASELTRCTGVGTLQMARTVTHTLKKRQEFFEVKEIGAWNHDMRQQAGRSDWGSHSDSTELMRTWKLLGVQVGPVPTDIRDFVGHVVAYNICKRSRVKDIWREAKREICDNDIVWLLCRRHNLRAEVEAASSEGSEAVAISLALAPAGGVKAAVKPKKHIGDPAEVKTSPVPDTYWSLDPWVGRKGEVPHLSLYSTPTWIGYALRVGIVTGKMGAGGRARNVALSRKARVPDAGVAMSKDALVALSDLEVQLRVN